MSDFFSDQHICLVIFFSYMFSSVDQFPGRYRKECENWWSKENSKNGLRNFGLTNYGGNLGPWEYSNASQWLYPKIPNISLFLFLVPTLTSHALPSELTVGFLVMRLDLHLKIIQINAKSLLWILLGNTREGSPFSV